MKLKVTATNTDLIPVGKEICLFNNGSEQVRVNESQRPVTILTLFHSKITFHGAEEKDGHGTAIELTGFRGINDFDFEKIHIWAE